MNLLHRAILLAATLVAIPASGSDFIDLRRIQPISGNPEAVSQTVGTLCNICHNDTGVSEVPIFPHVGGQKAEYMYAELLRYKYGPAEESPMVPLVASTSEEDLRNFSLHYSALAPATTAAPITAQADFDRGAILYREGDRSKGIPPCQGCHGANGEGVDGTRPLHMGWPRLRHQHIEYTSKRLREFQSRARHDSSNDFIMMDVAKRLDEDDIAALAAWIASAP